MGSSRSFCLCLFLLLSACGKPSLSRSDAQKRIELHQQLQQLISTVPIVPGEFHKGFDQGLWTQEGLTEKGRADFSAVSQQQLTLRKPASIRVVVTGISDVPMTQNVKEALFTWIYRDMPSVAKRFAVSSGPGTAEFRLFDDGWRLESVRYSSSNEPMQLSDAEKAEELRDVRERTDQIQEATRKKQREQARLNEIIQRSRHASKSIASYPLHLEPFDSSQPVSITLTDVDVEVHYRANDPNPQFGTLEHLWFGEFLTTFYNENGYFNIRQNAREVAFYFTDSSVSQKFDNQLKKAISAWRQKFPEASHYDSTSSDTTSSEAAASHVDKQIPSDEKSKALILDSLLDFNNSVQSKSFDGFHTRISRSWQEQITAEKLKEVFMQFIDKNLDISSIKTVDPILSEPPEMNSDGLLVLRGYYPTHPLKVNFQLKYIYEHPAWKLFGINVNMNE